MSDPRTLVKSYQYIDLPGEPPEGKLWPGVNNIIVLRKHRDVVFDIKLKAGATYTLKTDQPESKYGRFYDTRRKQTVGQATLNDGEPFHIWVGRRFQGNLILSSEGKEIGRYPIKKMDCTGTCTDNPKDKPAPMIILMHDDKTLVKDLLAHADELDRMLPSAHPKLAESYRRTTDMTVTERGEKYPRLEMEVPPMLHVFKIKQTTGPNVPKELLDFFASGAKSYKWDPTGALSQNFVIAQIGGGIGYLADNFGPSGPLRGFWNRVFVVERNSKGGFDLMFATSKNDRKIYGYLLGSYRTAPHDVRVISIAAGAGGFSSGKAAANGAAWASVSSKTWLGRSMYLAIAMDSAAWAYDQFFPEDGKPKKDLADLLAQVGIDVVGMWVGTAVVSALVWGALTGAAALGVSVAATSAALAIGTILLTVVVGTAIVAVANYFDVGDSVADGIRKASGQLEKVLIGDYKNTYSQSTWSTRPVAPIAAGSPVAVGVPR